MSYDYFGKSVKLRSMSQERSDLSLSGLPSLLIAIGGCTDARNLKVCERYRIDLNMWRRAPPLNTARASPGSIVLQSKRAFCFCGRQGAERDLNSIESLEVEQKAAWRLLLSTTGSLNREIWLLLAFRARLLCLEEFQVHSQAWFHLVKKENSVKIYQRTFKSPDPCALGQTKSTEANSSPLGMTISQSFQWVYSMEQSGLLTDLVIFSI